MLWYNYDNNNDNNNNNIYIYNNDNTSTLNNTEGFESLILNLPLTYKEIRWSKTQ